MIPREVLILAFLIGVVAGAFAGYEIRTRLVRALKVPDFVVATLEDGVAIGGGLWIVSRFTPLLFQH